ncbi:hypothetical protein LUZ60_014378 [Juncus effusus]|nr:hypothetical protein LUZ60_014378 [Juncus effusus]
MNEQITPVEVQHSSPFPILLYNPTPLPFPSSHTPSPSFSMGCAASRVENEDTVRRCKERRRLMKLAVQSRHLLAAAHSDYLRSMRLFSSSLSKFSAGEPSLSISESTPPVLLISHHQSNPSASSPLPPPSSVASLKMPHVISRSASPAPSSKKQTNLGTNFVSGGGAQKLPHILSDSSPATSMRKPGNVGYPNRGNLPSTPSMSSSVWEWENFYPPSPPDSEFFERKKTELEQQQNQNHHHQQQNRLKEEDEFSDESEPEESDQEREESEDQFHYNYSYTYVPQPKKQQHYCNQQEEVEHETRSEGGYASTSTSSTRSDGYDETRSRSERYGFAFPYPRSEGSGPPSEMTAPPSTALMTTGLNVAVRHRTLAEITGSIEEYFSKAAEAGEAVSEMLETGRAQLDRSFSHLKKTVYHSNSVLSALSSTWSSKPPLAIRYQLNTSALEETGDGTSHGSTLERLLAWEKKLYEEVKARESVKIAHEKKLSTLQNQEYRGKEDAKLDKTKAAIKRLQSLIVVTSQAVTTTSSAIVTVRDTELAPQLVELCFALLKMWRLMHQFHEIQNNIVQQVRGLVNRAANESTSDLQRMTTRDLEASIASWHTSFIHLIKYQRDYIRSLYSWLKLTLLAVSSDDLKKDHSTPISLELTSFCDEWKQALDRLPDTVASEAIKSFMNVIHVIYTKQMEELKVKKKGDSLSKELEKKTKALRGIEKKYYQSYSMVGLALPGSGRETEGQVFDARDPLAEKKGEINLVRRKVEDEMNKFNKAVEVTRSMTLNNIQTGLPGVFQALTGFSGLFVEALESVCRKAGSSH